MERVKHEVFPAIAPERFAVQMGVFDRMRETIAAADKVKSARRAERPFEAVRLCEYKPKGERRWEQESVRAAAAGRRRICRRLASTAVTRVRSPMGS